MPTLAEVQDELKTCKPSSAVDMVRRKYLAELHEYTKRPTLVYASAFTVKDLPPGAASAISIHRGDIQAFMAALHEIKGNSLDLVLHSGGGQAEATEQIVNYLRSKFTDIRVIVPQNAMSAATMLACGANEILMGRHSALGPIDPQLTFNNYSVPAQSILDEFNTAVGHVNGNNNPLLWIERLRQLPPGVLVQCQKAIELSKKLVTEWLTEYMLAGDSERQPKARAIAEWLGDNNNFLTHGRAIGMNLAAQRGLVVKPLEADQGLQEAVLAAFHATVATFQHSNCVKLVENHLGKGAYTMMAS